MELNFINFFKISILFSSKLGDFLEFLLISKNENFNGFPEILRPSMESKL